MSQNKKKLAIVFPGGGTRGIISLKLLNELNNRVQKLAIEQNKDFTSIESLVDYLGGTSIGSIIASAIANGYTADDITKYHTTFIAANYEGSMIRNSNGIYKCKYRSYDLLKNKTFHDAEFKIVDFTYETDTTGSGNNLVVWTCETEQGKRFNVQSKGTRQERQDIYKCAADYIGRMLSVQFFGYTGDEIPRFPKTLRTGLNSIREPE